MPNIADGIFMMDYLWRTICDINDAKYVSECASVFKVDNPLK